MKYYLFSLTYLFLLFSLTLPHTSFAKDTYWEVQSLDTMKFSRDLAREKLKDPAFVSEIDSQVKKISLTGANYVAIDTPYDDEFLPYLTSWVNTARRYNLNVWFRGNFSGWEGWFNYPKITSRSEHLQKIQWFISNNSYLFDKGDIFTPCTECENGGPGDPRNTGDIEGYRNFLIEEKKTAEDAFRKIGKEVKTGYFSMNGDVAKLIMDPSTTSALGGIVVIDHYVKTPENLIKDIENIERISGGKIILGEIGVPIPDIHGKLTEYEQNAWLQKALEYLSLDSKIIGINYWVSEGGTSAVWDKVRKLKAADTLTSYFQTQVLKGTVLDEIKRPIAEVSVSYDGRKVLTNEKGEFNIFYVPSIEQVRFSKEGYNATEIGTKNSKDQVEIILTRQKQSIIWKIQKAFHNLFTKLF